MDARRGHLTRRTLLVDAGLAGALVSLAPIAASVAATPADSDAHDEALVRMARFGPVFAGGLANHGPMAVEALGVLGRSDAIARWTDRYVRRLEDWPRSGGRIAGDAWRDALGQSERASDWRALFADELAGAPFGDVLARWLPRLGPGMSGSAGHGAIRVSHAARALAARDTAPRRAELAAGLAYWAASYHALPDAPGTNEGLGVEQALARVERLPTEQRTQGSIVRRLEPLRERPSFARAADLLDLRPEPVALLSELVRAFARVYCANAGQGDGVIARLHTVTGTSALRPLLAHVPASQQRALLRSAWQMDAAVFATHTFADARAPEIAPFASTADLVAAAVDGGDDHAIKLTEVCLREHALTPDDTLLRTAAHWVRSRA